MGTRPPLNTTPDDRIRARETANERRADARATASHTDATPLNTTPNAVFARARPRTRRRAHPLAPHTMALVDSDDDAPPPPRASCRACGHDHAPGTTCDVCGHHRRVDDAGDDLPRPRLGHDEPIIEVIDKFLCLGAFEHTSKEDVLLACGIRTVMNVRFRSRRRRGGRRATRGRAVERATGRERGDARDDFGGPARERDARGATGSEASANGRDEIEARETTGLGTTRDAVGRDRRARSAVTDERRVARERTERAAVHAVL